MDGYLKDQLELYGMSQTSERWIDGSIDKLNDAWLLVIGDPELTSKCRQHNRCRESTSTGIRTERIKL